MTKNFMGFRDHNMRTTGCSEQHLTVSAAQEAQIKAGLFGIVYSDKPFKAVPEESPYYKARKHHIKFSNGEELYVLSRYRKENK